MARTHNSNKPVTMPLRSWMIVAQLLNQSWANTPRDILCAGRMDEEGRFDVPEPPIDPTPEQAKKYHDKSITREFSQRELETIKRCVEAGVTKGFLFANKYSRAVILNFVGEE